MFIEALFIIAKAWKQPRCPSIDGQINKQHTMEYHSAVRIKSAIKPQNDMEKC